MQKILITGGSGTIGKILIPHLLGYGYDVDNYDLLKGDDVFNKDNLVGLDQSFGSSPPYLF